MSAVMKYLIITTVVCILATGIVGCNVEKPATPAKEITECDAVSIARQQVPARIAENSVAAGLQPQSGEHDRWFVTFPNVNVSREELDWTKDENTHLIWSDENSFAEGMPPDTYRNVTIYVDATNGDIIGREANNGLFTGVFSECQS